MSSFYYDPTRDNTVLGQALPIDIRRGYELGSGPGTVSIKYQAMAKRWEPILHLNSGTIGMREAKTKYLPKFLGEEDNDYIDRVNKAVLFEAYPKTIESVCSLPFASQIALNALPQPLEYLKYDTDGEGTSLEDFCYGLLKESFDLGLTHVLVEFPVAGGYSSLAEERQANLRPYFCHISPLNLVGWSYLRVGSQNILESIRIKEMIYETNPNNEYEEILVEQIREIKPGLVIEWRYNPGSKVYEVYRETPTTVKELQLVTLYAKKTGFMEGAPVAEGLAHLNIQHYQKTSDLDVIEHYTCVPILFGSGFPEDTADFKVGKTVIMSDNPDAQLKYVEITGAGVALAQKSVRDIQERMVAMGADLLTTKGSSTRETATSKMLDNNKSLSVLAATVIRLEQCLYQLFYYAAEWLDVVIPSEFNINIGDKMELSFDANEISNLLLMFDRRVIGIDDLVYELKRRNKLAPSTKGLITDAEQKELVEKELEPKTEGSAPSQRDSEEPK